jgi:hypothetical protein
MGKAKNARISWEDLERQWKELRPLLLRVKLQLLEKIEDGYIRLAIIREKRRRLENENREI